MAVELFQDFALTGLFLLIGYALRSKIKLFQKLYIPAAVLGGIVGLLLGPEVLGKVSPVYLGLSEYIGTLAMPLLAIVFSTQFIGAKFDKKIIGHSMSTCILNCGTACLQVFLGLILILFCQTLDEVPLGFGLMPFSGFYGGHGIGALAASVYESLGHWTADIALSVGNTFATFGMLFGITFGIIVINIAARRGLISQEAGMQSMSEEDMSGFIPEEKRTAAVQMVTKNDAINPVAFQMAIIGSMLIVSYWLLDYLVLIPGFSGSAITIPCIFVGIAVAVIGKKTNLGRYLDKKSLTNTSGAALEFLIASSVASTKLSIFVTYGFELALLTVVILACTAFYVLFFGKMWHKENWVENSLGTFGLATGVLATGFLLIRVADPNTETTAATNLAIGNSISTLTVQMYMLMAMPAIIVNAPNVAIATCAIGLVVFTVGGCIWSKITKAKLS